MSRLDDLLPLLVEPAESLSVEHKSWLDLNDKADRARLAKAVIAMANHGGGTIVVGMREDVGNGGELISKPMPAHIKRYNGDRVNAAVEKFATPAVHCNVVNVKHPVSGYEHAIITVAGDTTVPVMSKSLCEGVIQQSRAYVRKPGPKSEEANTPEEWGALFDRCIQSRRTDMLDAIRNIVMGQVSAPANLLEADPLAGFVADARGRWTKLVTSLPEGAPATMPRGGYEFAFKLTGDFEPLLLSRLKDVVANAHRIKHSGWTPFLEINREPYTPKPVGNGIETWLGREDPLQGRHFSDAAHSDFWRIDAEGRFFMKRGYREDGIEKLEPGKGFDIAQPIWRIGEALLFVFRVGKQIDGVDDVLIDLTYTGLADRKLVSLDWHRDVGDGYVSHDESIRLRGKATLDEIHDNLIEIVHPLLTPLYERFSFFRLSRESVAVEIEKLVSGRF